jgi:hypothetical protein
VRRLPARPSLRYSPPVKATLNLYDRPKADTGDTPRLENGAHPLHTRAPLAAKKLCERVDRLEAVRGMRDEFVPNQRVGRGVSPLLRDIGRLRPPLVGGPSGEADVLQPCSPRVARAAAVRPVRRTVCPATFRHAALLEPVPMALGAPPQESGGLSLQGRNVKRAAEAHR